MGASPRYVSFTAFATYGSFALASGDERAEADASRVISAAVDAIDAACSRFRADSEISLLHAHAGRPVPASALLRAAMRVALDAALATGGDVDPLLGDSLCALGYDRDLALVAAQGPAAIPRPPAARWQDVVVDDDAGTITLPVGAAVDLGATAKAWAVDRIAAAVADVAGGCLVGIGGDLAVAGDTPVDGWPVLIGPEPGSRAGDPGAEEIRLASGGLATSSIRQRHWHRGDREIHHIVDPRTGDCADTWWQMVTVNAADALSANIASTASMIRGEAAADWLVELGLASRLVGPDGGVLRVAGWPEPVR